MKWSMSGSGSVSRCEGEVHDKVCKVYNKTN